MGSLTNAISITKSIQGPADDRYRPLEWSKPALQQRLRCCITPHKFEIWHQKQLQWIRQTSQNKALENLSIQVAKCMHSATMKVQCLSIYVSGKGTLPVGSLSDRHVVISALDDTIDAFKAFRIVKYDQSLHVYINKRMALIYLREVFEVMLFLGHLTFARRRDGEFLKQWRQSVQESELVDFVFDTEDDYKRIENLTLAGILVDRAAVPASCLQFNPVTPVYYRNEST